MNMNRYEYTSILQFPARTYPTEVPDQTTAQRSSCEILLYLTLGILLVRVEVWLHTVRSSSLRRKRKRKKKHRTNQTATRPVLRLHTTYMYLTLGIMSRREEDGKGQLSPAVSWLVRWQTGTGTNCEA